LCNQRRSLPQTRDEFPWVDFSTLFDDEEDSRYDATTRESPRAETDRIYQFLTEVVMQRPEDEMALVGHSAWLFTMCNAVMQCQEESLQSLFATSEIRSMRLSFYRTEDFEAKS
jgi:broad specificity phosphatase PhoE